MSAADVLKYFLYRYKAGEPLTAFDGDTLVVEEPIERVPVIVSPLTASADDSEDLEDSDDSGDLDDLEDDESDSE